MPLALNVFATKPDSSVMSELNPLVQGFIFVGFNESATDLTKQYENTLTISNSSDSEVDNEQFRKQLPCLEDPIIIDHQINTKSTSKNSSDHSEDEEDDIIKNDHAESNNDSDDCIIVEPLDEYICNYDPTNCIKTFKHPLSLQKHIETVHLKIANYRCGVCQQIFNTKVTYIKHQQSYISRFINKYLCPSCDKVFDEFHDLEFHIQCVHAVKESFACPKCNSLFPHKLDMIRHIASVHKTRSVRDMLPNCKICGECFENKRSLNIHMRWGHNIVNKKLGRRRKIIDIDKEQGHGRKYEAFDVVIEKPFECNVCKKRFAWEYLLSKHRLTCFRPIVLRNFCRKPTETTGKKK